MEKDLNYYLSLAYKIELIRIAENEGGGYLARLPQFGALGIVGDGETVQEAIDNLRENMEERFREYLEEGLEIPEPQIAETEFSGKFIVRLPKYLHRELSLSAHKNGVSLNQYVSTLLAMNFHSDRVAETLTGIQGEIQSLNQCIGSLNYRIDVNRQTEGYQTGGYADEYPAAA